MKKIKNIILSLILFFVILFIFSVIFYTNQLKPVSSDTSLIEVDVTYGMSSTEIIDLLHENDLIKNKEILKLYIKLNNHQDFKAGNYKFSQSLSSQEIIEMIETGKISTEVKLITFKEGKAIKDLAKVIEDNTTYKAEDYIALLEDETYLDSLIAKYWFLESDIKSKQIYYPLEGYLFPETYDIYNLSMKQITEKLLDQTDKILTKYKDQINNSKYSIHELMTLASMVELEGNNATNRAGIAQVFYNRLDINMKLGSDVTSYYGIQLPFTEDITKTDGLSNPNPYNTRNAGIVTGLPIGPISAIGEEAINATLNPTDDSYLYFMADKNGKIYFSKTFAEQQNKIAQLIKEGLWYEYD